MSILHVDRRFEHAARCSLECLQRRTMTRPLCRAALPVLIAAALSCTSTRIENPWLNRRPNDVLNQRWQPLPPQRFREVAAEMRGEAVRMLENEASQRLPGRDVPRFVAGDIFGQPVGRFYLVRAVRTPGQNGSYEVLTTGRAVVVRFSVLSGSSETVQSALVVDLTQAPETVYVEISIAQ